MMDKSESINELAVALSRFQAAVTTLEKSKTVKVKMKSGGTYSYDYTPLDSIMDAIRKPLADNGLAVMQLLDDINLTTVVLHESGQYISASTPLMRAGDIKDLGSQITYMRRYALSSTLGIVTSEDVDGGLTDNEQSTSHDSRGPQSPVEQAKRDPRNGSTPFTPITAAQKTALHAAGKAVYGDEWDDKRPELVNAVTKGRSKSSNDLYKDEASTLISGINEKAGG